MILWAKGLSTRPRSWGMFLGVIVLFCLPWTSAHAVTVFAAASLTSALTEIAKVFESSTDQRVVLSFAGSSTLARQIQYGAPADVFISASIDWMDALQHQGLIDPTSRINLLGNSLALVAHGPGAPPQAVDADLDLAGLIGENRLAMALVDAVPAGIYGKAALQHLGLWDSVSAKVAQADNVRSALALVATGEAPYGVVYASDAAAEPRISVVGLFPATSHPPIIYPLAAIGGTAKTSTTQFMAFLESSTARQYFEQHGFVVLRP